MRDRAISNQAKVAEPLSVGRDGLLQRRCVCGTHTTGGGECAECSKKKLQRKLSIGATNDPLELEADRVAEQVMVAPVHPVVNGIPPRIQRFSGQSNGQMDAAPASVDRVLASPGRPLEPALRQDMGQRFGHDFASVRVHADAAAEQSAQDVNANAYTVGHDIVFGAGRFAPGTPDGRRLIAHELTHVVQDGSSASSVVRRQGQPPTRRPAAMSPDELWNLVLTKRGLESRVPPHAVDAAEDREGAAYNRLDNARAAHREQVAKRREAGDPDSRVGAQTRKSTRKEFRDARTEVATATKHTDSARANASERMPEIDNPNKQKLGHGTQTFAAIQVTDEQGGQVALGIDSYRNRLHSEENALKQIRFNLDQAGLKVADKPGRGWRVTVVVDQTVCPDRCRPALQQFANDYGIDPRNVVAQYPQRLSGPTVTPKTASRSAHENPVSLGDPVPILDEAPPTRPGGSGGGSGTAEKAGTGIVDNNKPDVTGKTPLKSSESSTTATEKAVTTASGEVSVPQRGSATPSGGVVPSVGRVAPVSGTPPLGGASARNAAKEILAKSATLDNLESAAKTVRWYMEAKNFADTLETIAKSIDMAAATLEHASPYYKEIQEANAFAERAKSLDDSYSAVDLKGKAPQKGDPEWDGWSGLQQIQFDWYLTEGKLTDALESISESRKSVKKQMSALRDELQEKGESLIFSYTSLQWADVYFFGDAARQIGKTLEEADFSLREAYNQVALQQGYARYGIKMMEIRLQELGVGGWWAWTSIRRI